MNPEINLASSVLPEPASLVAPNDAALPGYALLIQDRLRTDVMGRLLQRELGAHTKLIDTRAVPCRYVPGKRCNFQIELNVSAAPGTVEQWLLLGKIYAGNHGERVYETLQALRGCGLAEGRFLVSQPLAYDPRWKLLVLSWAEGELLRSVILGGSDASSRVKQAANWLLKLHQCGMTGGPRLTFRRHLETLELQGRSLAKACPEIGGFLLKLLQRIEDRGKALAGWTPGPTHRDYSPDHLIFGASDVTGLDFDEFRQYDPLFDVAHFMTHLRFLGVRYFADRNRFHKLSDMFQAEYRAGARDYSEARVRLYQAIAYFKLAHIAALVLRFPGWKGAVQMFLLEAERELRSKA